MTHTCRTGARLRRRFPKVAASGLALLLLALAAGSAQAQIEARAAPPPILLTETTWGGVNGEIVTDVKRAADGSVYLAGNTDSFAVDEFGQFAARGFLVKFTTNGAIAWQRIWNGETVVGGAEWSIALAPDGSVYLAGIAGTSNGGDAVLVKFDANGNVLWERAWGGVESDNARGVGVAADGSVYIGGRTTSFPTGSAGTFVVKFDAAGNLVWQRVWDGTAGADGLTVGPDGSVYAVASIIRDNNLAQFDMLTTKLDAAGNLVWARTYAAGEVVDARGGMAGHSDGSIYLAGAIQREGGGGIIGIEALVVKYDANGNLLFDKACCTKSGDTADGVGVGPDGSIHLAITTTSLGAGFQDAAVVRMQPTGKKVTGAAAWGATTNFGFETAGGVAVASDGTVHLGATTQRPPPYVLQGISVKVSSARGVATATPDNFATVIGTVAPLDEGADEPPGSTTYSGAAESALVTFTFP